jgi:tRNA/tmRNA/rRNA uracil-C5-methylase (TrmA/RlmC/RlmD family)
VGAAVADPARAGLGRAAVERLTASGAGVIALVSCDPASLARDARLLAAGGYDLDHVTVLDLFGHTSHVETVSRLVRR